MYSYGPPHKAEQKQNGQLEHTYCSSVRIRDVALKSYQKRWTIGRSGERGSGISMLAARHDIYIYIYIYIYIVYILETSYCLHKFGLRPWNFLFFSGTSPSDCLVSYLGHSFVGSYPSVEKQSVYSTAPLDWARIMCDKGICLGVVWGGFIRKWFEKVRGSQRKSSKRSRETRDEASMEVAAGSGEKKWLSLWHSLLHRTACSLWLSKSVNSFPVISLSFHQLLWKVSNNKLSYPVFCDCFVFGISYQGVVTTGSNWNQRVVLQP